MSKSNKQDKGQAADDKGKGKEKVKRRKPVWREYLEALLTAVLLALVIRTFGIQAFRIPSSSMEDTLLVGDFLFVNKFLYGAEIPFTGGKRLPAIRQPEHGDIIVFRFPDDPSQDYIKRCVAVEGDTIMYRNKTLFINGQAQEEDFTKLAHGRRMDPTLDNVGPLIVPEGHLYMMGDNRDMSLDSRRWGFLDKKLIRGKAIFIYWSWDRDRSRPRLGRLLNLIS